MATQRYTRGQVDNIIRQAELGGDTENTWIKNRRILATQPKCSCDLTTHTCQQQYTSDKGWSEECLPKSPPVYRLSNGGGNPSCMPTSCGDWACADETGCITDTCGGCDIVVCPTTDPEPELDVSSEGIGKLWQGFEDGMKVETIQSLQAKANELCGSKWTPTLPDGKQGNPDGWIKCVINDDAMMSVKVYEDGKLVSDTDYRKDNYQTDKADGYTPYIHPKAEWNCKTKRWYGNKEGMHYVGTGTVMRDKEQTKTVCKDGVTHTRTIEIHYYRNYVTVIEQSNHPGCPGMCLPPPKYCPTPELPIVIMPPTPTKLSLPDGREIIIPDFDSQQ